MVEVVIAAVTMMLVIIATVKHKEYEVNTDLEW